MGSSSSRPAEPSLFLRPPSSIPGTALQVGSHGRGQGACIASLLPVRALASRPISGRRRTRHRPNRMLSRSTPHAGGGGPAGSLRSRAPAAGTAGGSAADRQGGGADGGRDRRGYRGAGAKRDPAGDAVGAAAGGGGTRPHPVHRNGRDRNSGGEQRDGGTSGQKEEAGPHPEAKLGCVFTQTKWDEQGYPIRDADSTTYCGAIETADEFGKRIYVEAWSGAGAGRARRSCWEMAPNGSGTWPSSSFPARFRSSTSITPASTCGTWHASFTPTTKSHDSVGSRSIRTTSIRGRSKSWCARCGRSNAPAPNSLKVPRRIQLLRKECQADALPRVSAAASVCRLGSDRSRLQECHRLSAETVRHVLDRARSQRDSGPSVAATTTAASRTIGSPSGLSSTFMSHTLSTAQKTESGSAGWGYRPEPLARSSRWGGFVLAPQGAGSVGNWRPRLPWPVCMTVGARERKGKMTKRTQFLSNPPPRTFFNTFSGASRPPGERAVSAFVSA